MTEERTIKSVIDAFNERTRQHVPTSPHEWVEAAGYINVMIGDEHEKLYNLEQRVAKIKAAHISEGDSVAAATVKTETTDDYRDYRRQKAYVGQIEEFIRIAKIQARLKDNEMYNYS